MKASVIVFPGSNCDRDVKVALEAITGSKAQMVWHGDASVPPSDIIVLPGGFSYGDYLRCGAMAAHSNVMRDVIAKAKSGTPVLGICNGFQVLCETGLLPGVLQRNASLAFVCRDTWLKVERNDTVFTTSFRQGEIINLPVAHGETLTGNIRHVVHNTVGENRRIRLTPNKQKCQHMCSSVFMCMCVCVCVCVCAWVCVCHRCACALYPCVSVSVWCCR